MAALSVLVDPNECLSLLIPNEFRDPNEFLSSRLGIRARICCLSGWFVSLGGACAPRRVCGGPGSAAVARRFRLRSCIQNRIYINRSSLAQLRGSCSAAGELQAWAFRVGGAAGRGAARGGTQPSIGRATIYMLQGHGMKPRLEPRPAYPPLTTALFHFVRDVVGQGAVLGIMFTLAMLPLFRRSYELLRSRLSEAAFFSLCLNLMHTFMYASNYGFFSLCDRHGWLQQHKLERKPSLVPSTELVTRTRRTAIFMQSVTMPIAAYAIHSWFEWHGMLPPDAELPSLQAMAWTFAFAHVMNDLGFYWTHRLLHSQALYQRFHKKHHEYSATVMSAAEHAHPAEILFSNLLPTISGVLFVPTHPLCVHVWLMLRAWQAYENHSGYCFHGTLADRLGLTHANAAAHHDFHHSFNAGNFGVTMWTDYVFGTMDPYQSRGGYELYVKRNLRGDGRR